MTDAVVGTPPAASPSPARFRTHPRSEYWDVLSARWVRNDAPAIPEPRRGN